MRLLMQLEGRSVGFPRMRRAHCLAALAAVMAVASTLRAQDTTHAQQPPASPPQDTTSAAPAPAVMHDTAAGAPATPAAPAAPAVQAPGAPAAARDTNMTAPAATDTSAPAATADTGAQGQSAQTHTVKKGDTLWDLSHTYLGDPFLWPEIYRINTDVVEDPHWIYPGEKLRIPGGTERTVASDMNEPRFEPEAVPVQRGGPTVFLRDVKSDLVRADSRFGGSPSDFQHTAVRPGEFYAAPWADRQGGPPGQGELLAPAGIPGIAHAVSLTQRLDPEARAYITLPSGIVAAKGDRLLLFAKGDVLPRGGQLMIPTAVVQVERTGDGDATTVRVVRQFGEVDVGQSVMPLGRFEMPADQRPAPLALGLESQVISVPAGEVLPTIQRYVVLDATTKDGVKQGDEFTLYRPRVHTVAGTDFRDVTLPEEPIALAQVVKVTDHGTTAIIIHQEQPAIKVGVKARLTARMP